MKRLFKRSLAAIATLTVCTSMAGPVSAGPFLDSLFGVNRGPYYPVGTPVPVNTVPINASYGSYYGNYGYNPPSPGPVLPAGIPQTAAGYLPTAAYDTQWNRAQVTYYRPVTQFDPNYGTTVTSLQPCTSYQYQAQRVPLIAPRPLLGDYGYRANRWPAINAPGYYPTALGYNGPVAVAPQYQPIQQVPMGGVPISSSAASSSTIASSLPVATMPTYSSSYGVVPATTTYYGSNATVPSYVAPAAAWQPTYSTMGTGTPVYSVPSSQPVYNYPINTTGSSVVGAAANVPVPNIPGATSVIPIGPPTYSSTPAQTNVPYTGAPTFTSPTGSAPTNSVLPNSVYGSPTYSPANGTAPANGSDTNSVLPPGFRSMSDPESTRQPTMGSTSIGMSNPSGDASRPNSSTNPALANVDAPRSNGSESMQKPVTFNGSSIPLNALAPASSQPSTSGSNSNDSKLMVPPALSAPASFPDNRLKPIQAPNDFDASPKWNPKLLDARTRKSDESSSEPTVKTVSYTKPTSPESHASEWGPNGIRFVPTRERN